jgi:hypothetical protein
VNAYVNLEPIMPPDPCPVSTSDPCPDEVVARYQSLQAYVGWTDSDARNLRSLRGVAERLLPELVDDFHLTIQNHPDTARVLTGGPEQAAQLKRALKQWLRDLFCGSYDRNYVAKNWQIGRRQRQLSLPSIYMHAAMARMRQGLLSGLLEIWPGEPTDLLDKFASLNRLLDLNLAIIEFASQFELATQSDIVASAE